MIEVSNFFKKENNRKKVTLEGDVSNLIKKVLTQVFLLVDSIKNEVFSAEKGDVLDVQVVNVLVIDVSLDGLAVDANTVV